MTATWTPEDDAFARLFEAVHEGVYIGELSAEPSRDPRRQSAPQADLRLRRARRRRPTSARSTASASSIRRRATASSSGSQRDGAVTDYLLRLRRADGTPVWVEVTARAEPTCRGGLRVEALVRDVSERKKLDDQSRDLYHQLLQAEKMAALGQTISGVAHELNNPLATILTWAERLVAAADVDDQTRRGLETILGESERAAQDRPQPADLRAQAADARARWSTSTRSCARRWRCARTSSASRNITVIDALAAGLPQVFADAHQVQQVLLNLIINAEQAMLAANGRGTLVVRTWHDAERESVVLEVNDDGPGMPEDVQPKIFDPFFTTKEVGKGTGLGLTVAYAIVQEHGGRIRLESEPSGGARRSTSSCRSTRRALPPAAAACDGGAGAEPCRGRRGAGGRGRSRARRGGRRGAAATPASSSIARATAKRRSTACARSTYDLVICDLKMPRLDGTPFYRALARRRPRWRGA